MHVGGGCDARFVCGLWFVIRSCVARFWEVCRPAFKVNLRTDRAGHWLANALLHLVEEANPGRAGSEAVLAKMSEALVVDTLRRYFAGLPEEEVGLLAAARDRSWQEFDATAFANCASVDHRRVSERSWIVALSFRGTLQSNFRCQRLLDLVTDRKSICSGTTNYFEVFSGGGHFGEHPKLSECPITCARNLL